MDEIYDGGAQAIGDRSPHSISTTEEIQGAIGNHSTVVRVGASAMATGMANSAQALGVKDREDEEYIRRNRRRLLRSLNSGSAGEGTFSFTMVT